MSKLIITKESALPRKAHLYVLGCKVNQAEIDSIAGFLENNGFQIDPECESPELIFVNTCCVTDSAAGKSRRTIKRMSEKYPGSRLLVAGCLAEIDPEMIIGVAPKAIVLGTQAKDHYPDIILGDNMEIASLALPPASSCTDFSDAWQILRPSRSRAFLKVQDGCSHRCSYCIVPIARGPSRSMDLKKAVQGAQRLEDAGYSEIAITGIHLGAYGRDLSPRITLENLVLGLLKNTSNCRFRLSSIEPQEFSNQLLNLISQTPRVCRHFHIPVQSGDDGILKNMQRPYKTDLALKLLEKLLDLIPDACIGMDVIVGFPGETDISFEKTEKFIRESGCSYLHVFPFSPRKGSLAYGFPNRVPTKVARSRVRALRILSAELRSKFIKKFLGRRLEALIESPSTVSGGWSSGLTDNYISVKIREINGNLVRKVVPVNIYKVSGQEAYASISKSEATFLTIGNHNIEV